MLVLLYHTCLTCITYLAAITHSNQKESIITMNIMIMIRKVFLSVFLLIFMIMIMVMIMMMIMKRAVIITLKPDSKDGKVC